MSLHIETPLIESRALSLHTDRSIWLKMDALQPSASFKLRGIGFACETHVERGVKRFLSSSGGNAGIAVAYVGRQLGIPVVVVVPETTTEQAKHLIRQEDAEVIVHGASWLEANAFAKAMVTDTDAFVHPFDDPLLWEGHATMIDEVARSGKKPDAVVLSIGGGGLLCGVLEGLYRNGWGDVPVITAETEGAASFAQAVQAGERIVLPAITSVATSLGAKQVCEQAFAWVERHPVHPVVVSDKAAVSAAHRFLADHRVVVEPACGAALAVAHERLPILDAFESVLVIICGGATTSVEQLQAWSQAFSPH